MTSRLSEIQRLFFASVTGRAMDNGDAVREWLAFEDESISRERLGVYRDAYWFRLIDCLRDDFPNVASLAGARFDALATAYVARFPPRDSSLRHLGDAFAAFVAEHAIDLEFPWIGELARLERARVEAFDAETEPLLSHADLTSIAVEAWPAHTFRVARAARLLAFAHPAHRAWRALEDGAAVPAMDRLETFVLVWRRGFDVVHRAIDRREAAALRRALAGAPFAQVCEPFADDESLEGAAAQAFASVTRWIADGVLARDGGA
jgi:hypothetical protein